jgi:taurine transport system substrate-binding protein
MASIGSVLAHPFLPARAAGAPEVLRLGWFGGPRPWILGKAAGDYDKGTGTKVEWVQFASGANALSALASRQIDISRLGASPTVAGMSRKLPIELIAVSGMITRSERLIARSPISSVAELKGKKVAYPPGSTAHYALMAALKVHKVPVGQVTLHGMAPAEMVAAWQRGDIDAAFVWGPFSHSMEKVGGKQLLVAGDLQESGYVVWNNYVVRKEFGEKHPETVAGFLQTFERNVQTYKKDPAGSAQVIAQHLSQDLAAVKDTLEGLSYPSLSDQLSDKFLGPEGLIPRNMLDIGKFLVELGDLRASELASGYAPFVNTSYIKAALKR